MSTTGKFTILFLLVSQLTFGQKECTVTEVMGKVMINGKKVKRGYTFSELNTIPATNSKWSIVCICEEPLGMLGIFSDTYRSSRATNPKEYWKAMGVRGGDQFIVQHFEDFINSQQIGIFDSLYITLKGFHIELTDNHQFYVRYVHQNMILNKVIPIQNDSLVIGSNFFYVEGNPTPPDRFPVEIYLLDEGRSINYKLHEKFHPVFIDKKKLRNTLSKVLRKKKYTVPDKLAILKSYLYAEHPQTNFTENTLHKIISAYEK
tara:strand:+ start:32802 stop:33584 length:783 start_codon:yes stop_codon:yes gene_type:complete